MALSLKLFKIGICYFSTKHATLRSKSKDWLSQNQDNAVMWLPVCRDDYGEEVALLRLTSLSRWSKAKFKSPCNFEESPASFMKMLISCFILKSIVSVFEHDFLENIYINIIQCFINCDDYASA